MTMPAITFTMSQEQYEALVALAREGATAQDKARQLDEFLKIIERQNGVTRDGVWVQWQEMDEPLPAGTNWPDTWPPQLRYYIEFITRRVSKADVEAMLAVRARSPVNVLVTKDPGARVGWTPIDQYFVA